jgi:hypothetical protein
MAKKIIPCQWCDKNYTTAKGLQYHYSKYHLDEQDHSENNILSFDDPIILKEEILPENVSESHDAISPESEDPEWAASNIESDDETTDFIPHTYKKMAESIGDKNNPQIVKDTNIGMLMAGYSLIDVGLSRWANFSTMGEIEEIKHSHRDKLWTSNATYMAMRHNGWDLSTKLTPNMIAIAANSLFIGQPLLRINKMSKKTGVLKGILTIKKFGWLAKLNPMKWFRKKKEVEIESWSESNEF